MKKTVSCLCISALLLSLLTLPALAAPATLGMLQESTPVQEIEPDIDKIEIEEEYGASAVAVSALPTSPTQALAVTSSEGKPYLNSTYSLAADSKGYIKITAAKGMYVSVFTTGSTNTYLRVYKTSSLSSLVASDDNSAHSSNAYVNFFIPKDSTYYVEVSGATRTVKGNYGLVVHRGAATSGSEKPSMFTTYNGIKYKNYNNCYTYSLGYYVDPRDGSKWRINGQNPGEISGDAITISDLADAETAKEAIVAACKADAKEYGGVFRAIGKNDQPASGYYKVALVLDPGTDYHWYRQIEEGNWTHKPGTTKAKDSDDSGYLIYYPDSADTGDYTEFLGYYEVKTPAGEATYSAIDNAEDDFDPLMTYPLLEDLTSVELDSLSASMSEDEVRIADDLSIHCNQCSGSWGYGFGADQEPHIAPDISFQRLLSKIKIEKGSTDCKSLSILSNDVRITMRKSKDTRGKAECTIHSYL